jgi:Protein of unknown function (DUF2927)
MMRSELRRFSRVPASVCSSAAGQAGAVNRPQHRGRDLLAAFALALIASAFGQAAHAENSDISLRRASERTGFSNDEIRDGFFKTAFHAELQFGRRAERIRKFDQPVRIFIDNRAAPERSADIAAIVADIRAHIDHLDFAVTSNREAANFLVILVPQRDVAATIRSRYGASEARQIQRELRPECLSGFAKDKTFRIRRAEAILPADVDDFGFFDCAYEELLQGLGIINDDNSVPWTMFNDDVQMGFFDIYDQYLLNILYDPRIRPGMGRGEVDKLLPEVLPTVRALVTHANAAKPAGADASADQR